MADEIKNETQTNIDEINPTDESLNTEETKEENVDNKIPYDRFKAKVDEANALKEKLAEIEQAQAEQQRKELEQQNEFKALYEQAQAEIAKIKTDALNAKKDVLFTQAGYAPEQIEVLRNTVAGETDEELTKAIEELKAVIPPKKNYIDPSPMGGGDGKPKPKDGEEIGKAMYERIKHRIRGI